MIANAVFAGIPIAAAHAERNVQGGPDSAPSYLKRPHSPLGVLDLHPRGSWDAPASGEPSVGKRFPDWALDFDGATRAPGSIGAYVDSAAPPVWTLQLERKPRLGPGRRSS